MEKKALSNFDEGYNCTQSILKASKSSISMNEEETLKISMGLGFGMYIGETCGAVTGAIMALGLKYGSSLPNDRENIRKVYKKIKKFEKEFKLKNGSLNCKELKIEHKVDCRIIIKDTAEMLSKYIRD